MTELEGRYMAAKQKLFDLYYQGILNPEQSRAVCTAKGPLLILAGAGSGKTTVLVHRIVFLIRYGDAYHAERFPSDLCESSVLDMERAAALPREEIAYILPEFIADPCPPWGILAITFTNKAAREIKERLAVALDDPSVSEEIWAGTFHSICVRILRRYGDRVGYAPGFSIYDTDEQKRLVTACMKQLGIDEHTLSVRGVMNAISHEKDALHLPQDMPVASDLRARHIRDIYTAYQAALMRNNAMDFDDIILRTVQLLEQEPEVLSQYQRRFRYVCVDEYQDTNYAQFRLTELLSAGRRNIMVVGDDDQSIYKFRGATIENILNFDKTYPDATVIKLEQNYRSTRTILDAANAVIVHNTERHEKHLWCSAGPGEKIVRHACATQERESGYIIEKILELAVREKRRYADFAVLYRVNELARTLESAFAKSGVPYRVLGGQRFYDRKEIRDLVAYLVMVENGRDDQKLKRIINEPKRKIGQATIDAIEKIAQAEDISMLEVLRQADQYVALARSVSALRAFSGMIDAWRAAALLPSALLPRILEESGYLAMLGAMGEEGKGKIDSVNELISAALEYEKRAGEAASLGGFLEEVALVSDVDKYDENADAVVLMTIHSAKGLEFPVVFLAGMEEGIFPGAQAIAEPGEMGEERRLAYVAITRAKERLFLTHASTRLLYGRTMFNPPSRFATREIPAELVEEESEDAPVFGARQERRPLYDPFPAPRTGERVSAEFSRRASVSPGRTARGNARVERLSPGTRVVHSVFGPGTIQTAVDLGGDLLYEVCFDNGQTKKLMATYARLVREKG